LESWLGKKLDVITGEIFFVESLIVSSWLLPEHLYLISDDFKVFTYVKLGKQSSMGASPSPPSAAAICM
jgi:hypothetical protein